MREDKNQSQVGDSAGTGRSRSQIAKGFLHGGDFVEANEDPMSVRGLPGDHVKKTNKTSQTDVHRVEIEVKSPSSTNSSYPCDDNGHFMVMVSIADLNGMGDDVEKGDDDEPSKSTDHLVGTLESITSVQGHLESNAVAVGGSSVIDIYDSDFVMEDDAVVVSIRGCGWGPRQKLSRIEDMPDYLQFNKYVHTGYRQLHSGWGSALSVVYPCPHNETVNILTHLIPIIFCLFYWPKMFPWDAAKKYPYLTALGITHVICCIIPLVGSTVYHTFMNCRHGGISRYKTLLRLDMFGIWITQSFGGLTNVLVSGWCLSPVAQNCFLGLYTFASVCAFHQCLRANTPMGRRTSFALCVTVRFVGIGFRLVGYGGGYPSNLLYVILQDLVAIAGGLIGALLLPERLFPGRFDYFLNSHNYLHILGVMALAFMNMATNSDAEWILENIHFPRCQRLI